MRIDYTLYNKDTMMMRFMSAIALLMVFAVTYTAAQEELTPLEKYQKSQQHSLAVDKRITARQTVLSSIDEATLLQAYEDLLRFSQTDEQKTDALTVLEEAVGRANPETNSYRQGMLTKGKLLKRLGRDDESLALFQDAIQSQWLHAVWRYSESLIDAGELDKACQLEYDRVIGEGDYAHYCAEKEDFFIFITLLRLMKSDNPDAKAMELVFPALEDSAASPQAKAIAQALCLVQDEQYDEAITLLKQVDVALTQSRESDKNAVVDEYRNTPLYLTTALLFQGTDLDTAREAYGEFIKRNDGNWKHIYDRSMRVVRDLTILPENNSKIPIVTQQMLSSNIINDDEIKHLFSDDEIASIYDLHQLGLYNLGMVDEAAQIQNFVIEKYYPHTLAGATCALNKALYTAWRGNDLETAKNILIDILIEADFQEIVPWVKVSLAHIEYRKENYQTALELVNDVVNLVDDNQKGTIVKCRENALELKQLLIAK